VNSEDMLKCRHESLHATAAWTFGQRVNRIARGDRAAITWWDPDPEHWVESAAVLFVPFLDDPKGCEGDLAKVRLLVDAGKVLLSDVWTKASRLLDDPDFRRRARAVEGAFMSHPDLSGEEVMLLIAAS
jgi:hypothetical protein